MKHQDLTFGKKINGSLLFSFSKIWIKNVEYHLITNIPKAVRITQEVYEKVIKNRNNHIVGITNAKNN